MTQALTNHTVKHGDTVTTIASKYTNLGGTWFDRVDAIKEILGKNDESLKPGDKVDLNAALVQLKPNKKAAHADTPKSA